MRSISSARLRNGDFKCSIETISTQGRVVITHRFSRACLRFLSIFQVLRFWSFSRLQPSLMFFWQTQLPLKTWYFCGKACDCSGTWIFNNRRKLIWEKKKTLPDCYAGETRRKVDPGTTILRQLVSAGWTWITVVTSVMCPRLKAPHTSRFYFLLCDPFTTALGIKITVEEV